MRSIFEKRPKLHGTSKSREYFGEIQRHKVEYTPFDQPRHRNCRDYKTEFKHRSPRLVTLEEPLSTLPASEGATCGYPSNEIDRNEGYGTTDKWRYRGKERHRADNDEIKESGQSFHRQSIG